MPAAAVVAPLVMSAGASVFQSVSASKRAKQYQKEIDDYQRQTLENPYENLQVSTLGADRQREDLARSVSTNANLAAMGGTRGILALAPQMVDQQNQQEAQIAAGLDQQYNQNQLMEAKGNEMVQNMQENREQQDLLGLGNALNTARQEQANGINNLVQTGISAAKLAQSSQSGQSAGGGDATSSPYNQMMSTNVEPAIQQNMAGLTPSGETDYNNFIPNQIISTKLQGVIKPSWANYQFGNYYNPMLGYAMPAPNLGLNPRL